MNIITVKLIKRLNLKHVFYSLAQSQSSTEEKDEIVATPIVCPKSENNSVLNTTVSYCAVSQKLDEIIDEDMDQNNSFISYIPRDPSIDSMDEAALQYNMISIAQVNSEDCGVPMSIFDNVCIC